jgi:hypothetical protein
MNEFIMRTAMGVAFLLLAERLLAPRFSVAEVLGLFFVVVAAKI